MAENKANPPAKQKPKWEFLDGADYKGTYRYADELDGKVMANFHNEEDDVEYSVIVEKATGTELESETSHKRVAFVALKDWLSIDKKFLLYPVRVLNPCEASRPPMWIKPEFLDGNLKMSNAEMHRRHILLPFPLSHGFKEIELEGKLVEHFPSFAAARRWMEEKCTEFKDMLPSSDNGQKKTGRGNRKRKVRSVYSPERSQPRQRKKRNGNEVSRTIEKVKWTGPIPNQEDSEYEDYMLAVRYNPKKTTENQDNLKARMAQAKKKVTVDQMRRAAKLDSRQTVKTAKEDLGVMSQDIETPNIDGECDSPLPSDDEDGRAGDNSDDETDTSGKESSDDGGGDQMTMFVAELNDDASQAQKNSQSPETENAGPLPIRSRINVDGFCEQLVGKLVPRLNTALDGILAEQIANKLVPTLKDAVIELLKKKDGNELSYSAGYLVADSIEFGLPVSGRHAATSLDLLLLRNPDKLKLFRIFILSQCLTRNIPKAIMMALQLIFDQETLGERLCVREFVAKGGIKLTPNGGRKLKMKELPTLIGNTMTFLAVAILTLIEEDEITTYLDGEVVPELPPYDNAKVYKAAEERMKSCWANKKIMSEVKKAVVRARDLAHRQLVRLSTMCGRRLHFSGETLDDGGEDDTDSSPQLLSQSTKATFGSSNNSSLASVDGSFNIDNTQHDVADSDHMFSTPGPSGYSSATNTQTRELDVKDF